MFSLIPSSRLSAAAPYGQAVAILLCTFNGEKYLAEQLESIISQTHADWVLYVSDDGSADGTRSILEDYRARLGTERMVLLDGPRRGFACNFLSLIKHPEIRADFYAFCDQDDIWFKDRLERGLKAAATYVPESPFLYCSRTRLIDASGQVIGHSPLFMRRPTFHNALVQSLAGANTMLLNESARALLTRIPDDAHVVSHDWIAYILVSGCGGRVVYDAEPTLDYRQHGANVIGSNNGLTDRWLRIRKIFSGTFQDWNNRNLDVLERAGPLLTDENRGVLRRFMLARQSRFATRLRLLHEVGLYRQTLLGNIGLVLAAGMGKL